MTALSQPPRRHGRFVDRSLTLGNEALTVVIGPAGAGKTTLLASWREKLVASGNRATWFAFGRTVTPATARSSLEQIANELGVQVSSADAVDDPVTAIERLNEKIPARDRVLFLDDAGFVDRSVIDDVIELFVSLPGPPWRLVFAGRRPIKTPLSVASPTDVRTIGSADLRLDGAATIALLASYRDDLDPEGLAPLVEKLDGWPAGVHLAGRLLAEHPNIEELIDGLDGRDVDIADYLEAEIFNGIEPNDQDFLVLASVLSEPCAEGCRFVTGDPSSAARLAFLGQHNALLSEAGHPTDEGAGYRWMPLARDFLLGKLGRRPPQDVARTRTRARDWAMSSGRYHEAIELTAALEDWDELVDMILAAGLEIVASPRVAEVVESLRLMPPAVVGRQSGVAVVAAAATWAADREQAIVDDWLDYADTNLAGRRPACAPSLQAVVDTARASFGSITSPQRRTLATSASEALASDDSIWAALAFAALGEAAFFDDEPLIARDAIIECLRRQPTPDDEFDGSFARLVASTALGYLALLELDADEPIRAEALLGALPHFPADRPAWQLGTASVRLARARCYVAREPSQAAAEGIAAAPAPSRSPELRVLALLDAATIYEQLDLRAESARCISDADSKLAIMQEPGRLISRRRYEAQRQTERLPTNDDTADAALSERELEVLQLLATDLSRREIASQLFIAHNTVKTYVQRLYLKLGVSSRPAAIAEARKRGWLS